MNCLAAFLPATAVIAMTALHILDHEHANELLQGMRSIAFAGYDNFRFDTLDFNWMTSRACKHIQASFGPSFLCTCNVDNRDHSFHFICSTDELECGSTDVWLPEMILYPTSSVCGKAAYIGSIPASDRLLASFLILDFYNGPSFNTRTVAVDLCFSDVRLTGEPQPPHASVTMSGALDGRDQYVLYGLDDFCVRTTICRSSDADSPWSLCGGCFAISGAISACGCAICGAHGLILDCPDNPLYNLCLDPTHSPPAPVQAAPSRLRAK